MDHLTLWRAHERTIEARERADQLRLARMGRRTSRRSLLDRIRAGR